MQIVISIHAPRVGGDYTTILQMKVDEIFQSTPPVWGATTGRKAGKEVSYISIHAPRVGGDGFRSTRQKIGWVFQSTPPVWGATPLPTALGLDVPNFNPRPPCGGRPSLFVGLTD